jgi:1-acyl-sn-glycerol-3-phosphate acyltransferase
MKGAFAVFRSVLFLILEAMLTVVFALLSLLTFPFPPLIRYRIITTWSCLIVILAKQVCGVRYRVIGRENLPERPCIVLCKHQSAWETLALQVILPPQVWVLKRELLHIPFFGWGLAMLRPVAIDRGSPARALRQTLEQGRARLASGLWIVMFPEGTRIAPGTRGKYHLGGAWLACQADVPVVPIAHNAGTLWRKNALVKFSGEITVSIGPAIDPSALQPAELNQKVEHWIETEVARLGSACR